MRLSAKDNNHILLTCYQWHRQDGAHGVKEPPSSWNTRAFSAVFVVSTPLDLDLDKD